MTARLLMVAAFVLIAAISAHAQDYPKAEVFGGYSYLSRDVLFDDPFDDDELGFFDEREGFHGVGFSVAGNFHKNFGLVGDFSYHRREIELPGEDIDFSNFVFLFGPRATARGDKVEGFGQFLIGGVRGKVEDFDSDTELALGIGGGVDFKVSDTFAVRALQLDYIPVRQRNPFTLDKEWSHNIRIQAGVTIRIQ
jgi:opacity protein-like surface antigen